MARSSQSHPTGSPRGPLSEKAIADAINYLVNADGVYVREIVDSAIVSGFAAQDTDALKRLCSELQWSFVVLDAAGE